MKHEHIESLIDLLNTGGDLQLIFLSALSDEVDFAKVWLQEPRGGIGNEGAYDFYFIKNESEIYVAAVLDMFNDLHVFVKEEHRGNGYLTSAMHQVIFPHLYQGGRETQHVTFIDDEVGRYVEKCWGFEIDGEQHATKSLKEYAGGEELKPRRREVTKREFEAIKNKIDRARLYIIMAAEQLESALGEGEDGGMREVARMLLYLDDEVLDFIEEHQDRLAD